MKLAFVHLLVNLTLCLAVPEFSLAPSCGTNDGDFRRRDGIIGQIIDAIGLASNAHKILTDHIDDKYVLDMTQTMLGNSDFQAKLDKVKESFRGISEISDTPSQFMPLDEGWAARRSNLDVAFWCDGSRFPQAKTSTAYHKGWGRWIAMNVQGRLAQCYATDYQLGSGVSSVKAMTTPSHVVDWTSFVSDRENGAKVKKTDPQYRMMRRDSNDVDLYKWFVETADQQGWPKIDKARVDKASTTEFREGLTHPTVPIDGEDSGKYRTARGQKLP
ncbi:hypothetical protein VDGL01_10823 [Verticillium dahliae]